MDDTNGVRMDHNEEPRPHPPERLTEREAALYARSRFEAIRDVAAELLRFAPHHKGEDDGDTAFEEGYAQAYGIVKDLVNRIARLDPAPELPPAMCGLQGTLCRLAAGHPGLCSVVEHVHEPEGPPPEPTVGPESSEPSRIWSLLRRAAAAGLFFILEEIRDILEEIRDEAE